MSIYLIIFLTLLFSAFFSGMEIAFVSSNKLRLEIDKQQEGFSSRILNIFAEKPSNYIATMLIGNNVALVIYGMLMAIVLEPVLSSFTSRPGGLLFLQTLVSTLIILVTAEFLPKTIFRLNANNLLNFFAIPVFVIYVLLYPITIITMWLSDRLLRILSKNHANRDESQSLFGKIDLNNLVNEANDENTRELETEHEIKYFQNALDFSNVKVRDCMAPRPEIEAVDIKTPISELKERFVQTGFSKIPVFNDNIDNILGYVHTKDLFKNPKNIADIIRKISIVPETMPANKILRIFIQDKKSSSIVVDEFGGVSGLITIEDVIEEIFGEIEDEHDNSHLIEKKIDDKNYIFAGRFEIDYLNEKYKLNLPESDEYDTLAGLIFYYYESLPKMNETVHVGNLHFKILKMSKTRIEILRLEIH